MVVRGLRRTVPFVAAVVLLSATAPAQADPGSSCSGSPDNASVNQYCEAIPAVGGQQGIDEAKDAAAALQRRIPKAAQQQLREADAGGVIQPSAPASAERKTSRPQKRAVTRPAAVAEPKEIPAAAEAEVSASAVLGGLPVSLLILAAIAVVAVLSTVRLSRRRDIDP